MVASEKQLRILMAYEHYPCSIALFWKRALRRLGHHVDTVGHCTYGKISWGDYDLSRWTDKPTYELPSFANQYRIDDSLRGIAKGYDLFVNVDAAHWWMGSLPIPKVIVGTDPHCLDYDQQRRDCDMFVCMQECYSKLGDVWIPYAHDPEWHFRVDVPIDHDVTFLGVLYDERRRDIERLKASGVRVVADTGIVFDEGSPIYSAGWLAYCRPSLLDLPTRFFEAMAYGNVPLLTHCPDLAMFADLDYGLHYELFSCASELVDVVKHLLEDEEALLRRRKLVMEAVKSHRWDDRAQLLLRHGYVKGLLRL